MKIDADKLVEQAVAKVLPWEFVMTIGGKDFAVRPISVGDLGQISGLKGMGNAEAVKLIAGLFEEPGPDVMSWTMDQMQMAVTLIANYFKDRTQKNSDAIAAEAERPFAMARKMN